MTRKNQAPEVDDLAHVAELLVGGRGGVLDAWWSG